MKLVFNKVKAVIIISTILIGGSAQAICICEFHDKGWVCKPKGCWLKPGVPPLGQSVTPKLSQPRINPQLINPKKPFLPGDQLNRIK